jgi:4a-hydroxytetrahydrobiopterin dehydratase
MKHEVPSLRELKCVPCRGGEPTVTDLEIKDLHPQVSEWDIVERNQIKRMERVFKFKNFKEALEFTNKVGKIAEEEGHHPVIVTEWGRVKVSWWTHKIKGLHQNDFIMAAKTNEVYALR